MRLLAKYLAAAGVVALLTASAASAATPREIYRDYADNGRLDGHYSKPDLDRALKSAVLQGYGDTNVQSGFKPAAKSAQSTGVEAAGSQGALPFTGLDLAFMLVGGGALILLGLGLRRLGRSTS
jgi:opacity protein-like surface antigen